ncbi:DUF6228 family protein [Streptomyces microflavus]|uniref:DUF6228 family protein n=1 Tax=Streptomyces microflavus TaxID=1919 RepID=UPI0036B3B50E
MQAEPVRHRPRPRRPLRPRRQQRLDQRPQVVVHDPRSSTHTITNGRIVTPVTANQHTSTRSCYELYGEDPTLDFLVKARGQWVSIETLVRTWDGDGLDTFLSSLAEDFRGWEGARNWRSLERDLTISAEHRPGGYVHLT